MKHYTPSLDEFHNGFKYEEFTHGQVEDFWTPLEFKLRPLFNVLETRVKYLDKDDIESLGFRIMKPMDGFEPYEHYSKEVDSAHTITMCDLFIRRVGDEPFVTAVIDNDITPLFSDFNIKNLSELKWVLNRYGMVGNNS